MRRTAPGRARRQAVGEGKQRDLAFVRDRPRQFHQARLMLVVALARASCNPCREVAAWYLSHDKNSAWGSVCYRERVHRYRRRRRLVPIAGATGPAAHLVPGRLSGRLRQQCLGARQVGGRVQVDIERRHALGRKSRTGSPRAASARWRGWTDKAGVRTCRYYRQ